MHRTTLVVVVSAVLAAPALAEPVTYTIDSNHTFPRFSYSHMGMSTQLSRFDKTTGTIVYDAVAKTASVDVTIDMKSVSTGSAMFNNHIQGADLLDTASFPTATFKSTAVKFAGDRPATIEGNLTIKGVTRPVTLTVTAFHAGAHPMMKKPAIGADATTRIRRSDFNAGKNAPMVGDEVTLNIALEAMQR
ncbi:MAG: YceI family protein [Gammaproteobacteria bacterium]|nr:YceI family protein [Gammaproteobacteria bacterium]